MVWGVCVRALRNTHDAEDAFQATFVVLARKAGAIRQRERVGNWLYGAAYRATLEAKAARRRVKERQVSNMPEPAAPSADPWRDLRPLLDQELNRLPDKYRVPVVLCDLEGRTRRQVARQLGIADGTLSERLSAARRLLAKRLARHGLTLSGGALAAALSQNAASATAPAALVAFTVKAAASVAAGHTAAAGVMSAKVAALTQGVLKAMLMTKLKIATALLLSVAMIASLGVAAATRQETPKPAAQKAEKPQPKQTDKPEATVTWKERAVVRSHEDEVTTVAFVGKMLLTGTGGKDAMRLWDLAKGDRIKPDIVWKNHPVELIVALPDGDKFAVFCTKPSGEFVNAVWTVKGPEPGFGSLEKARSLAITSDGKIWVEVLDGQKKFRLLRFPPDGTGIKEPDDEHEGNIQAAAFSPDDATLATASEDKTVKLWDCATAKLRATCKGPKEPLLCVAFAPDGKTVAAGSSDGTVWLWDATTAEKVATLRGHEGQTVNCLTFTPNGKLLATGGADKTVALWDVATAKRLAVLKGHTGAVRSVAFSHDAGILASGGQDKEVRLWEQAK
jgi:RNA polymerase sigma factor (sigma-70 family)